MNPTTPTQAPTVAQTVTPVDPNAAATTPLPGTPATPQVNLNQFLTTNQPNIPGKQDVNPATGKAYAINPSSGVWDDNYWTNTVEPQLKAQAGGSTESFDLLGATNAVYNTPEIQAANKAITDRQQALANAQTEINDNPFYAEASRTGRLAKLQIAADADITVQQNKLAGLKSDAAIKLAAVQGQYNIDEQAYQQKLSNFQNLVSMGGLDGADPQSLASIAVSTGIPLSMLQSIQKASVKSVKPQIINSTNSQGDLTIAAVDPTTGQVIGTTTINGAGKGTYYKGNLVGDSTSGNGSTGGGSGGGSVKDQNIAALMTDIGNKVTLKSLVQHYGAALSIDQIYQLYASNSPWGAPKESLAEVKKGSYAD